MKVSLKWLNEYVDIDVPLKELAERLTGAGLEVNGIQTIGSNWQNIVIGKIISVDAHPNADLLKLVTINLGNQQPTVVCGAPNLTVGDKVPFAKVGAQLIDSHTGEAIKLKPVKIRGVLSEGMACSEKELGISDRHEGLMILNPEAPLGDPLSEYLGDSIIDLDITPNRPDCLSVIGIAREISALTGKKLHIPETHYKESGKPIDSFASVEITDPALCPRYCASLLIGIKIDASPQWLQQRLLACGMRPISNIVDVTNYVMLEYGQPLHAFDYEKIRGRQIIVRRAKDSETMVTLDGAERTLNSNMLAIADKERAVAVAGVMGGLDTEVTDYTTMVLMESANFNQAAIHRGGTNLRLSSEASIRFEKGLSPELPLVALKRATQLMLELTGGQAAKGIIDVYPGKLQTEPISLSTSQVKQLLGIEMKTSEMITSLELLGFNCEQTESSSQVRVKAPWWRTDINCAADLVEETARIIGYDNIPTTMLSASLPVHEPTPMLSLRQKLRNILVSCGFQEILTYSLTSLEMLSKLSPKFQLIGPDPMKVVHPMSRDLEYLRTSLRASVLSALARNERYQENGIRLFEIGKIFLPQQKDLPQEKEVLCAVLSSLQPKLFWHNTTAPVDFFVAKGVVETLLSLLGLSATFETGEDESLHPGRNVSIIIDNNRIGALGELHHKVSKAFELTETAYLIEFDLDKLASLATNLKKYTPIPRYPSTTRDIALLVNKQTTYHQVYNIIQSFPLVNKVTLFDIYSGEQVPADKKSLAFNIAYQSPTHTLTDEEVNKIQQQILDKLTQDLGATLRA